MSAMDTTTANALSMLAGFNSAYSEATANNGEGGLGEWPPHGKHACAITSITIKPDKKKVRNKQTGLDMEFDGATVQFHYRCNDVIPTQKDPSQPLEWKGAPFFLPANPAAIRQMLADGELWIALAFNPNEAANEIAAKRLADSVYSFQFASGTIGNTHFLAIPVNARAREGAQVVANFLLSPLAQARKAESYAIPEGVPEQAAQLHDVEEDRPVLHGADEDRDRAAVARAEERRLLHAERVFDRRDGLAASRDASVPSQWFAG